MCIHIFRHKGTTIFWNVQDFKQKKCSLCLLKHNFLLKRLSFAHKCERIFGGNPLKWEGRRYCSFFYKKNKRKAPT